MRSLNTKTRIPLLILLGLIGAGILLHGLHTAVGLGGAGSEDFFTDSLYIAVLAASSLVCLLRGMLVAQERWAWIAFGLGLGLWAAGDAYWSATPVPDNQLSSADYLYLGGYPAVYAGIALLVRARVARFGSSMWLDGAIGALAAAALGTTLLAPVLADLGAPDTTDALVDMAYPVGDILLLSFVVGAIAIVGVTAGRRDWLLIAGGLTVSGIADGAYLYQNATSGYVEGTFLDTLWLIAAGLIALAACSGAGRSAWAEANVNRSLFFPSLFAIIAVALQVHDLTRPLSPLAAGLATATLAVVVLRLFVAFSENSRLLATVRRDSITDALTGLGNRRKLLTDLQASLDSGGSPDGTAFAIFDLDGFKAYNDSYGHGAGDLLLNRLGRNLAAAVKPFGMAYRLGGDEFCVIVSAAEDGKLDSILAAASTALSEEGEGFSITCSRGAVRIPHEAHEPTQTLRLADRRMYAEKGRRIDSAGRQTRNVLMSVLREREPELGDHLQGVAKLSVELGRRLAFPAEDLDILGRAAELHDIGKMAIPDEILHKPGPLNQQEWALLRTHTLVGERILDAAPAMGPVARLVRWTHERWDGRGYPDGLAGDDVPIGARIIFVCDAFDAMTSQRTYKPKIEVEEAIAELRANAGTQFDPMIVELLCEVVEEDRAATAREEDVDAELVPARVPATNGDGPQGVHDASPAHDASPDSSAA